jgi:hypothetical protein
MLIQHMIATRSDLGLLGIPLPLLCNFFLSYRIVFCYSPFCSYQSNIFSFVISAIKGDTNTECEFDKTWSARKGIWVLFLRKSVLICQQHPSLYVHVYFGLLQHEKLGGI